MGFHERARRAGHALPSHEVDRSGRSHEVAAATGLYLDENDRTAIDRHDVNLAVAKPASRDDDTVTPPPQIARGGNFAALAKRERPKLLR